jgi:hypothetical protein
MKTARDPIKKVGVPVEIRTMHLSNISESLRPEATFSVLTVIITFSREEYFQSKCNKMSVEFLV